jgi:hypothetical protein
MSWALWAAMTTLLAFEFPTLAILLGLAGFMLARLMGRSWPGLGRPADANPENRPSTSRLMNAPS